MSGSQGERTSPRGGDAESPAEESVPAAATAKSAEPVPTATRDDSPAETSGDPGAADSEAQPALSAAPSATDEPADAPPDEPVEAGAEAAEATEVAEEATAKASVADTEPAEPEDQPAGTRAEPAATTAEPAEPTTEPAAASGGAAAATPEPAAPAAQAEPAEPPTAESVAATGEPAAEEPAATADKPAAPSPAPPETPALRAIREALEQRQPVEGRVIGWNNGGFHLAIGELAAFCPRSEMEAGEVADPASYLDQSLLFRVLRLQGKGRRIVVSRAAHLRAESNRQRGELRKKLQPGAVVEGTVASLADFGAFVELGGGRGLIHVSEISHSRVDHPSSVLSEGQQVKVKVLKIEKGGRRISLSMRALEPDPWKEIKGLEQGAVVKGKVEKANELGAFIEVAPGLTGLLPARSMSIPRETTPARAYPPGKEVSVQIISIDRRRQRISLAPEGSSLEGSRSDYKDYQRERRSEGEGFNALASAFRRLENDGDQ